MAIIRSGILGNMRGKVGGVVGGQFKDVNYIREYVKPANPNTAAQQVQRALMRNAVAFAKTLVGPVFNAYTDKFQKYMSGFNFFIKSNIPMFTTVPSLEAIFLTSGKLSPVTSPANTYDTANGNCVLSWDENLGNNGATDDKVFWALYDKTTKIWYFADGEVDRDAEADTQTIIDGLTATNLLLYMFVAKYSGTLVDIISDSGNAYSTAA